MLKGTIMSGTVKSAVGISYFMFQGKTMVIGETDLMKQNNPLAYKRCDAMLLSWFLSLTLTSDIPTNILSDCYQDVRIDYISPKANAPERLAFYLLRISNTTAIVTLRLVYKFYNIITLCRK